MNLSEQKFDEVRTCVEVLLNEPSVRGIAAEFVGREFTVSYFKNGEVFDRNVMIKPPHTKDRNEWYNVVIPQMNELVPMLNEYAKELNVQFAKDYANLLRKLDTTSVEQLACVALEMMAVA